MVGATVALSEGKAILVGLAVGAIVAVGRDGDTNDGVGVSGMTRFATCCGRISAVGSSGSIRADAAGAELVFGVVEDAGAAHAANSPTTGKSFHQV